MTADLLAARGPRRRRLGGHLNVAAFRHRPRGSIASRTAGPSRLQAGRYSPGNIQPTWRGLGCRFGRNEVGRAPGKIFPLRAGRRPGSRSASPPALRGRRYRCPGPGSLMVTHAQSYQRCPLAPAPADSRCQAFPGRRAAR